jgi:hypothetical protein
LLIAGNIGAVTECAACRQIFVLVGLTFNQQTRQVRFNIGTAPSPNQRGVKTAIGKFIEHKFNRDPTEAACCAVVSINCGCTAKNPLLILGVIRAEAICPACPVGTPSCSSGWGATLRTYSSA